MHEQQCRAEPGYRWQNENGSLKKQETGDGKKIARLEPERRRERKKLFGLDEAESRPE